ncbi:MAG: PAS domain S-box protein [Thermodesulforhabdaceae bacterium]
MKIDQNKNGQDSRRKKFRVSIAKKLTFVLILVSVIPASIFGITHILNLHNLTRVALKESSLQLEKKARESLELRAIELANRVSEFLQGVEKDAKILCLLPKKTEVFQDFYTMHKKTVWMKDGTNEYPVEVRQDLPLYREIAFVDVSGQELIRIFDGYPVKQEDLRDVSKPENTTYRSEKYFLEVMKLPPGRVYVSHVTGWFVSLEEQLQGASDVEHAVEGKKYEGVVRFATKCVGENGEVSGVVVLSLDHRHLMEFTMHILPTEDRFVVFPSYSSGNYAFMFDDEGWIITHPKYCDIRSLRPDGTEFDPLDPSYYENLLAGKAPFNLDHAGKINTNYPIIASEVRKGRSGVTSTFNVGGIPRVMAYAPIHYYSPPYDRYGIFGGVTIGVEMTKFKEPISTTEKAIKDMLSRTRMESALVLTLSLLVSIVVALSLARTITKPIRHLSRKAVEIAERKLPDDIVVHTGDELEGLSENLAVMAREIHEHRLNLEKSLEELTQSKKNLEQYSYELERKIWIIKNIHSLSQLMSLAYKRDDVLQAVLKTAVEGLGYDRAILYLFDSQTRRLVCRGTYQFSPDHEKIATSFSFHVDRQDCTLVRAFHTGKTVSVGIYDDDISITELDKKIATSGGSEHIVWAPMKSRDRVIGVLGADKIGKTSPIGTTEIEALEILAGEAAQAIEHSELYWRLVKEKNFVTLILAHIPLGVIVFDGRGKILWFNPYAERFFGIPREEVEGKHFFEAFADFTSWTDFVRECSELGCSIKDAKETSITFPDGKEKVIEYSSSVLASENFPESNLFIFFQDITSRKEIEEHLRRTDRLASLGVLAAGIAHEIRNPLTGISLMMDDLHDRIQQSGNGKTRKPYKRSPGFCQSFKEP